jgi:predicted transcriptional regulator
MDIPNYKTISELTLEELFPTTLGDTICINLNKGADVWVATLMCAQYVESFVDSIIVRDDDFKPIGIISGYDVLAHLQKNPTRDFQYNTKVGEIMFKNLPQIEKTTKFVDLIQIWKKSRRAFTIIDNEFGDCSSISARKLIEVGRKCKTEIPISSMPKKKIVTFQQDDSLGKILTLMFENNTRKLLLENSDQFISDRLILGEISRMLKYQKDKDHFLDIPINQFQLENVKAVKQDLNFNQLCTMMEKMKYPCVTYNDTIFTPWDVCLTLLRENLMMGLEMKK